MHILVVVVVVVVDGLNPPPHPQQAISAVIPSTANDAKVEFEMLLLLP
jgi:hypothetical protein